MRGRRPITLAVAALAAGVSLFAASSASASSYTVTALCTSGGKTLACSSGWYTGPIFVTWTWSPMDGNPAGGGCQEHSFTADFSGSLSCTVQGHEGTTAVTQPIHMEISNPTVAGAPTRGRPKRPRSPRGSFVISDAELLPESIFR